MDLTATIQKCYYDNNIEKWYSIDEEYHYKSSLEYAINDCKIDIDDCVNGIERIYKGKYQLATITKSFRNGINVYLTDYGKKFMN